MNLKSFLSLIILAALWGASFLFIRIGVTEFGPAALMALRVVIAAVVLLIVLGSRNGLSGLRSLRTHAGPLFVVGVLNSAAPFCLFAIAEQTLSAGLTSVINATTPLWGALVAFVWLKETLSPSRVAGMALGFGGVLVLVWYQIEVPAGGVGGADSTGASAPLHSILAAGAALGATFLYGVAANYTKRALTGVPPLVVATGSMTGASVALLPFALLNWPTAAVSVRGWGSVICMALACTALAYLMYFRLIAKAGPAAAMSVTFLIPVFGILWGNLFLAEPVSPALGGGVALVLAGTALATGLLQKLWPRRAPSVS
jgi:drug/metabolite transporter (DMT)-like permease